MKEMWKKFLLNDQHRSFQGETVLSVKHDQIISKNESDLASFSTPKLELKVELDSWSPIYKTPWGENYKEKLSPTIFEDQGDISQLNLNSYVDHEISISKLIASTIDNSMKVTKSGNTIIAEIAENKNDPLLTKVFDLTQRGVITSNSFIFKALDAEYVIPKDNDLPIEVIYTKGELISIDPVYAGFYPQNTISVKERSLDMTNPENLLNVSSTSEDVEVEQREVTIEVTNPESEIKVDNNIDNEVVNVPVEETPNQERQVNDLQVLRAEANIAPTLQVRSNRSVINKTIDMSLVRSKCRQKQTLDAFERKALVQEFDNLTRDQQEEASMVIFGNKHDTNKVRSLIERSLDGTTDEKGLVLIETLTNPKVLSEMQIVFPELGSATQIMPLIGLNEVKQPIMIPSTASATSIAEGAASTLLENTMTEVTFKPTRYSLYVSQNNQLNNYAQVLEKQTIVTKNAILKALRKSFYDNLLVGVSGPLVKSSYEGGATQESVVNAAKSSIQWSDLEKVYKELVDNWGDSVPNMYTISMHTDTLTALEEIYFNGTKMSTLISQLYNPLTRTYRGIKINATTLYTGKNTTGQHAVTFYLKSAVYAYGCSLVTIDDRTTSISEDQSKRFVRTRGEIKMCDPHLNTRVIKLA